MKPDFLSRTMASGLTTLTSIGSGESLSEPPQTNIMKAPELV